MATPNNSNNNRIVIDLPNGYKLVAEQNTDPTYNREIFVGIVDSNGVWHQDLAVIRSSYIIGKDRVMWKDNQLCAGLRRQRQRGFYKRFYNRSI